MAIRHAKDNLKHIKRNIARRTMARNMAKKQLPSLVTGIVGGALAGLGVSYLVNRSQQGKMASSMDRPGSATENTSRAPRRRSAAGAGNTPAGTNLAASRIQTEEQKASDKPDENDSLGG